MPVQRCTLPLSIPLLPYGPYGLYRASVPVQRCTFNFTYTSTPPMDRTACTEPHCLYKGAIQILELNCTNVIVILLISGINLKVFICYLRDLVGNNNNSIVNFVFYLTKKRNYRSQWSCGLRRRSAAGWDCGLESHRGIGICLL